MTEAEKAKLLRMYMLNLIVELAGAQGKRFMQQAGNSFGRLDFIAFQCESRIATIELGGESIDFATQEGYSGSLYPEFKLNPESLTRLPNRLRDPVTQDVALTILREAYKRADEMRLEDDLNANGEVDEVFIVDHRVDQELIEQQQT